LLVFEPTDIGAITMPDKTVNIENAFIIARSEGEIKGCSYLQTAAFTANQPS